MNLDDKFSKHHRNEYLHFERIPKQKRKHCRADICAFIYLHEKLAPNETKNLIGGAGDEVIYFDFPDQDLEKLTEDDVIYLTRCGILYSNVNYSGSKSLFMYV